MFLSSITLKNVYILLAFVLLFCFFFFFLLTQTFPNHLGHTNLLAILSIKHNKRANYNLRIYTNKKWLPFSIIIIVKTNPLLSTLLDLHKPKTQDKNQNQIQALINRIKLLSFHLNRIKSQIK